MTSGPILINGHPSDGTISVTDSSVLRGDGCFEVMRSYGGKAFAVAEHVERLHRSAEALGLGLPSTSELTDWIESVAETCGDCLVRVVVTRGSAVPGIDTPPSVIVFGHDLPAQSSACTLFPLVAPWQGGGVDWQLAGAKTLSYAPNLASTRSAVEAGFEDALLLTTDGLMLEGPTFSVGWVVDGVLETPALDLGILDSITRRVVLDEARRIGIEVVEGRWGLDRLDDASEVLALSTVREVQPVSDVGDRTFEPGDVAKRLAEVFAALTG